MSHYLDFFTQEEFETLIEDFKEIEYILEEKTLDLICSFERDLSENDIIFLVERPKINFLELLINFGKNLFDKDGEYIGEYRSWTGDILHRLNKYRPTELRWMKTVQ